MELITFENSRNVLKEKGVRDDKLYCGHCFEESGFAIEMDLEDEAETYTVNCNADAAECNKIKCLDLKCSAFSRREIVEIIDIN